jgi:molybdate transport system ATP-binding protein
MSLLEFDCSLRYSSGFQIEAQFATEALVTGLVGPSGSGKTSILSLIAGLRVPQRGRIRLGNRVLVDTGAGIALRPEARRVGYVFQDYLLFPHLTARQNLSYGYRRRPSDSRPVRFERVTEVLELGGFLDRLPHTLSGGERQRVALGRALLCGPELLLLDEPLASVDGELREKVLSYFEQIVKEWHIPTIYVTHVQEEVKRLAQGVVALKDGRIVAQTPAPKLPAEDEGPA